MVKQHLVIDVAGLTLTCFADVSNGWMPRHFCTQFNSKFSEFMISCEFIYGCRREVEERPGWCHDPHLPPCAGFVEIMAPVFSRESWRCAWHMIQNDLVHGWGLDLALRRCVEPPHEKIGVVDAQWIEHKVLPSLGNQGEALDGRAPWEGVRARCNFEWKEFERRMDAAEKDYLHTHHLQ